MRKCLISLLAVMIALTILSWRTDGSQERTLQVYGVAFYNLENLFDTIHDEGKSDYEYLPDGTNKWGALKYSSKLKNMSQVLANLGTEMTMKTGLQKVCKSPAIIGLSEIENRRVLEDLLKEPALKDKGWDIIHVEGPDQRGVDCAFLYNPAIFKLQHYHLKNLVYEDNVNRRPTRGFLIASGTIAGDKISFIVNHWPSRSNPEELRRMAGRQLRVMIDSVLAANPAEKVVIMGDLNDDPKDKSISQALGAKHNKKDCKPGDMFNPWYETLYKVGQGTLLYDGKWNLFDQIIISENLLTPDGEAADYSSLKFRKNEIYLRDFLITQEGKTKGAPKRTFASGAWLNGYSDHLPTQIFLVKEI